MLYLAYYTRQLEGVKHGVVKIEQRRCGCKILMVIPNKVMFWYDCDVKLRMFKGDKEIKSKIKVPHYTLFPVNNVASVNEWFNIMFGTEAGVSCQWMPCTIVAKAEDVDLDDGSEDGDLTGVACIPVRAAYLVSKATFPLCNSLHDRIFLNGLMTLISERKPTSFQLLANAMPKSFFRQVYRILKENSPVLSGTAGNHQGMLLSELEDLLDVFESDSDNETDVTSVWRN